MVLSEHAWLTLITRRTNMNQMNEYEPNELWTTNEMPKKL